MAINVAESLCEILCTFVAVVAVCLFIGCLFVGFFACLVIILFLKGIKNSN